MPNCSDKAEQVPRLTPSITPSQRSSMAIADRLSKFNKKITNENIKNVNNI